MDEEGVRLLKKIAGALNGLNSAAALIFAVLLYIAYRVS